MKDNPSSSAPRKSAMQLALDRMRQKASVRETQKKALKNLLKEMGEELFFKTVFEVCTFQIRTMKGPGDKDIPVLILHKKNSLTNQKNQGTLKKT